MGESVVAEKRICLNVGCGHKYIESTEDTKWINIDLGGKVDVEADVRKLPFDDNYADEIMAIHVVEHFYVWEILSVLKEWHRVLKPGGKLILELPDLEKVLFHFYTGIKNGKIMLAKTWWALYGDPRYETPEMVHKWAYSFSGLRNIVKETGFKNIERKEPEYHMPARDMRLEAYK